MFTFSVNSEKSKRLLRRAGDGMTECLNYFAIGFGAAAFMETSIFLLPGALNLSILHPVQGREE
jgi:hypothetical protein